MTDAPHKPTPAELDDLFRPDPLFALAKTIAAGPIVEAARAILFTPAQPTLAAHNPLDREDDA